MCCHRLLTAQGALHSKVPARNTIMAGNATIITPALTQPIPAADEQAARL